MFSTADSIVAIATPPGRGGLGVVRVSGGEARRIAERLLGRTEPLAARHATFARVVDAGAPGAPVLDHIVATWFAAPRSYTGEDVVEISAHGSPVLLRRIVELAVAAGARLAEPGEFTLRAYLNGRLDLIQAEAVADLVDAVTPLQARAAMDQLEGTLTGAIARVDERLFDLSARLEASLDFPDEGFHFITRAEAAAGLSGVREALAALAREGRSGRVLREGRIVVIAGRPNAGKSSLFNALVGTARAIVTDVPGTTRDMLTERIDIGGVPVTVVDTAGLRESGDAIEIEGVRRARQAQEIAALSILVVDGSAPLEVETDGRASREMKPHVTVVSKTDLPRAWHPAETSNGVAGAIEVSVVTGQGLDRLRARIVEELTNRDDWRDPPAISNARHVELVDRALEAVDAGARSLAAGASEELVLAELMEARAALEEVRGRRSPDELLAHIFGRFCVGK